MSEASEISNILNEEEELPYEPMVKAVARRERNDREEREEKVKMPQKSRKNKVVSGKPTILETPQASPSAVQLSRSSKPTSIYSHLKQVPAGERTPTSSAASPKNPNSAVN